MVDLALSSLALAFYSQTQRHPPAATEAALRYSRLLRVAQEQLGRVGILSLDEGTIDECLLTIFLMGRYEGAIHRPGRLSAGTSFSSMPAWFHHDGAMAILKIWKDDPRRNTATCIIKRTRRGLIRSFLLRSLLLPEWILNGYCFGERGLELDYDHIFVRMVNLHHASASLRQKKDLPILTADELDNEAQALDEALQDWATRLPSTCSYQPHILTESGPWPDRNFYSSLVYSYSKPGSAAIWGHYFAARMLINNVRLKLLELKEPNTLVDRTYAQDRLECIRRLKTMANSLASTVPFCVGRFKADNSTIPTIPTLIKLDTSEEIKPPLASLAVWPLTIASGLEGIDVRQQRWFRSQLARIGRKIGDGALEFADTDQWAILPKKCSEPCIGDVR